MTNETSETQPLVSRKAVTYSTVNNHEVKSGSSDEDFCLDDLGHVICRRNGLSNGNPPPPSSPTSKSVVMPVDSITYTWQDMNVFTTTSEARRRWAAPWRRQSAHIQPRKQILKNVSGVAHPGELLAIMGASGAGKTTLLNTLMFRSSKGLVVNGQCAINGVPVERSTLASLSAYVQQDDLFIGTLTVREHLIFHALVRMDRGIPYKQRMVRVEEVIRELALTKCQHTVIGITGRLKGISGGEMKRLSFAAEVLTNPPLMFCDEPTSGLDSFMAQNVVAVMKNMADKGKTVVATIHQPSSEVFAMFDKVLLMAEGRVAFIGTTAEACAFFNNLGVPCPSNYNPADFFILLLAVVPTREDSCRDTIEMVCDAFDHSEAGIKLNAITQLLPEVQVKYYGWGDDYWHMGNADTHRSPYKASWLAQFRAVLWRSWISVIKDPILIRVRVLQTLIMALVVGIIFQGQHLNQDGVMNFNGAIFMFLTAATFQNVFAVINVFCGELPVFMREHLNGTYRVDVYFLCKTLSELPLFMFLPVFYTCIVYYMVGLNPEFIRFLTAMLIIMLVANVATSFGYLISCVSSSRTMALKIGPPIIMPFLLFGGFFFNVGSIPPYFTWISDLSWFRYGNEALLINQWEGVDHIACTKMNAACPGNGHVILESLNFQESHFPGDIAALVGLILVFRVCAFTALLCRTLRAN